MASKLTEAVRNGDADEAVRLLSEGADPDAGDMFGFTSLVWAAHKANDACDLTGMLLAAGASVEKRASKGRTALMLGAWSGNEKSVSALLAAGADITARDDEGMTASALAAENGRDDVLRLLLEAGADPDAWVGGMDKRRTLLMCAALMGRTGCVRVLLEAGAEPDITDANDVDAEGWAEMTGKWETAGFLASVRESAALEGAAVDAGGAARKARI